MADNQQASLFSKMARVMGELQRVPKTGRNKQQGYEFATESDIADTIRAQLAKHNIAFFASMVNVMQTEIESKGGAKGYHTVAEMEYMFACGDTGQTMTMRWMGESDAYDDKGVSKAATLGQKYFLLKTFVMSTGDPTDDPDYDHDAPPSAPASAPNPRRVPEKSAQKKPAPEPESKPDLAEADAEANLADLIWTRDPDTLDKMVAWAMNEIWPDIKGGKKHAENRVAKALDCSRYTAIPLEFTGSKPDAIAKIKAYVPSDEDEKVVDMPAPKGKQQELLATGTDG